jgi:hypothetical protein
MKSLSQTILARRHGRSLLFAVVAGVVLAAPAVSAQAAPARVTAASMRNAPGASRVRSSETGPIRNYVATTDCIGTSGGHNNTDAVLWPCNGTRNQTWTIAVPASGVIQPIKNGNGDCLGVAGGSTQVGAHVVAWKCQAGAANQEWYFGNQSCYHAPLNYTPIFNEQSKLVIGVAGGSTKAGAALIMWRFQNTCNNQFWVYT